MHFAKRIRSREPVLQMNLSLSRWSVASNSDQADQVKSWQLSAYEGELATKLVQPYMQQQKTGPIAPLISAALRYCELDLPGVSLPTPNLSLLLTSKVSLTGPVHDD